MPITCISIHHIVNNLARNTIYCIRIARTRQSYLSDSKHPQYRCFLAPHTSTSCPIGIIQNPRVSVSRNRGGKFNLPPPTLHSPFTPSSPLATKMPPTRPLKVTTPARKKPNRGITPSIPPQKERPVSLRDYPWLNSGRQTSSSSSRWRKDAKASSPRLKVPPVFSPQWAQQARAASQSARFVSSPQDRH